MTASSVATPTAPAQLLNSGSTQTGFGLIGHSREILSASLVGLVLATSGGVQARSRDDLVGYEMPTSSNSAHAQRESLLLRSVFDAAEAAPEHAPKSLAEIVRHVRASTGLTWDQLARVFGVSRRAVHHWANGGKMNSVNEQLLLSLASRISSLPAGSPDEVRLSLGANITGQTLTDVLRSMTGRPEQVVNRPAFSLEERTQNDTGKAV